MGKWLRKHLGGHFTITWPVYALVYGWNAMHVAVLVRTYRWGWLCFHPPVRMYGRWWPWYFYASPDATPSAATFRMGPGARRYE
jgi:hypothetical protein